MPSLLSLSETKSAHIGDATRPGLTVAECGRRSLRSGLPANPYSMRGACEFDCSSVRKIEADAEDAARQIRQHGQGSRAESSRSAFHNIHSAMAIAARLVDPECPSPEGEKDNAAGRRTRLRHGLWPGPDHREHAVSAGGVNPRTRAIQIQTHFAVTV